MDRDIQIRGRVISSDDLRLIRQLLSDEGYRGRTHLSRRLCRLWDWRQANGAFREIACRDLLRKLEQRGLISLPPLLFSRAQGKAIAIALSCRMSLIPL